MKKRQISFTSIGIPSIFLIFSVLCLVILSLLSLETSRSDLRNSQLSLKQTTAYYQACTTASALCVQAEEYLQRIKDESLNEADYTSKIAAITEVFPDITLDKASQILTFHTKISDSLSLYVKLQSVYPDDSTAPPLQLLCWNTQTEGSWNPDTRQSVFKGETK